MSEVQDTPTEPESTPVEAQEAESAPQLHEASAEPVATESKEKESEVDWWNPETYGDTPVDKVIESIKQEYFDKSKSLKTTQKEHEALQKEMEQTVATMRQALADPQVYKQYREQLGYRDYNPVQETRQQAPSMPDFSKMDSVEDVQKSFQSVVEWATNRIAEVERTVESRADAKLRQVADPIARDRWQTALDSISSKYEGAWNDSVARRVVNAITQQGYQIRTGEEAKTLEKVFRAECPDEYDDFIRNSLTQRDEAKRASTTAAPKKVGPSKLPTGNDIDSIMARVNSKLGRNSN
jgi:CHASE3 domain sensor protein